MMTMTYGEKLERKYELNLALNEYIDQLEESQRRTKWLADKVHELQITIRVLDR